MRALILGLLLTFASIATTFADDDKIGHLPATQPKSASTADEPLKAAEVREERRREQAEVRRQEQIEAKRSAQAEAKLQAARGVAHGEAFDAAHPATLQEWSAILRSRVANLLAEPSSMSSRPQRLIVSFKTSEAGDVFDVRVEGEPRIARQMERKLLAAHMPAPPDRHDHAISVGVNLGVVHSDRVAKHLETNSASEKNTDCLVVSNGSTILDWLPCDVSISRGRTTFEQGNYFTAEIEDGLLRSNINRARGDNAYALDLFGPVKYITEYGASCYVTQNLKICSRFHHDEGSEAAQVRHDSSPSLADGHVDSSAHTEDEAGGGEDSTQVICDSPTGLRAIQKYLEGIGLAGIDIHRDPKTGRQLSEDEAYDRFGKIIRLTNIVTLNANDQKASCTATMTSVFMLLVGRGGSPISWSLQMAVKPHGLVVTNFRS